MACRQLRLNQSKAKTPGRRHELGKYLDAIRLPEADSKSAKHEHSRNRQKAIIATGTSLNRNGFFEVLHEKPQ